MIRTRRLLEAKCRTSCAFVTFAVLSGCVTGHRTLDLPVAPTNVTATGNRGLVYVAAISDNRVFQNKPSDPSIPSVAGDVNKLSPEQKDRMVGRQRNTWGHAMGDITLPPGDSMTARMRLLVERALAQDGIRETDDPHSPNSISVVVNEFWSWMTPGFWALTFETKIASTVTVASSNGASHTLMVRGYGLNHGQFAKNSNWQEAFQPAFDDYVTNLASEFNKLDWGNERKDVDSQVKDSAASPDVYEQLKKLDELRKGGVITDQEFEAQKKKLLDHIQ